MRKIVFSLLILCLFISSSFVVLGQKEIIEKQTENDYIEEIKGWMDIGHMPSFVAGIVKNNTLMKTVELGYSHYYLEKDVTVDTVFPIASVTKSITATAMMQIIENESYNISLDDNVSEYLPFDLKNPKFPWINITYRMLLSHQSSIGVVNTRCFLLFSFDLLPNEKLDEYFIPGGKYYNSQVWMDYPPGGNTYYSSLGINVLGYLIERITNQSYVDYCQKNIFNPLKMYNTSFYYSDFDRNQLVGQYFWMGGIYFRVPRIQPGGLAAGAIKSTISDLSHYMIMHTSGGVYDGVRILKNESVEEIHRAQYPNCYDGAYIHGFGWYMKTTKDGETYGGHGGNGQGCRAEIRMRYSDKTGVIYFWNQNSFFLMKWKKVREEEKKAPKEIEKILFEMADEL